MSFKIDCELKRVPGYLFAAVGKDTEKEIEFLQLDASLANAFGFDADFIEKDPLFDRPAVRFPNQLKFHPLNYVNAVAKALPGDGCHVFSKTSTTISTAKSMNFKPTLEQSPMRRLLPPRMCRSRGSAVFLARHFSRQSWLRIPPMLWRPKLNQRPNLSFGIRTIRISTSDSIHVTAEAR